MDIFKVYKNEMEGMGFGEDGIVKKTCFYEFWNKSFPNVEIAQVSIVRQILMKKATSTDLVFLKDDIQI